MFESVLDDSSNFSPLIMLRYNILEFSYHDFISLQLIWNYPLDLSNWFLFLHYFYYKSYRHRHSEMFWKIGASNFITHKFGKNLYLSRYNGWRKACGFYSHVLNCRYIYRFVYLWQLIVTSVKQLYFVALVDG